MHKALYRSFRPLNFDDVIGQQHITKTLKNQIRENNLSHAYLFTGIRGTGKTSTAKIFARALNCLNKENVPCNECKICKGILEEQILDVIEMDAASNNGVDDIRELRENIKYPPSMTRYKVYIIDEVHMLSTGAFNALLKTLEEPPNHAIFLLATTEPHKIPTTILSRCQRFDFKRVSYEEIVNRMEYICKTIGTDYDKNALYFIASNSQGSMRDAISMLDQAIAFCDERLEYDGVVQMLGAVSRENLKKISESLLNNQTSKALIFLDEIASYGRDLAQFLKDLIRYFRDLMICKTSSENEAIIELAKEEIQILKELVKQHSLSKIIQILKNLSNIESEIKYSTHPRMILEMNFIKITNPKADDSLEGILSRLENLENGQVSVVGTTFSQDKKLDNEKNAKAIAPNACLTPEMKEKIQLKKETLKELMDKVYKKLKQDKKIPIGALLKDAKIDLKSNQIQIIYDDNFTFHQQALEKDKIYLTQIFQSFIKQNISIAILLRSQLSEKIDLNQDLGELELKNFFKGAKIEVKDSILEE